MNTNTKMADEEMIRCVGLYYEDGKSRKDYREKENFRLSIPRTLNSLTELKKIARYDWFGSFLNSFSSLTSLLACTGNFFKLKLWD